MRVTVRIVALAILIAGSSRIAIGQGRYANVVDGLLAAWKTADIVCLGEVHGHQNDSDLRIALVQAPAFPDTVRVIAVEFAAVTQQALLDRFILETTAMSREELAPVWRDSGAALNWESPVYERFFRAVQEVNVRLPRNRRIRIIAGDRSIDWSSVKGTGDLEVVQRAAGNRTLTMRSIVEQHLVKPGVKGLAIYGASHCDKGGWLIKLAGDHANRPIWSVGTFAATAARQRAREVFGFSSEPAYAVITGTRWATLPSGDMLRWFPSSIGRGIGDAVDAAVYYGDVPDTVVPADVTALDASSRREFERRRAIMEQEQLPRLPDEARQNARRLWGLSP